MASYGDFTDDEWRAGRADMIKKTYADYADPQTGRIPEENMPDFEEAIVSKMYKYGDVAGVKEYTAMQKQNKALDLQNAGVERADQQMERQKQMDAFKMAGAAADSLSNTYGMFQKQYGTKKADEMIAPLYAFTKDSLSRAGVPMSDAYDHNVASTLAKQYRSWLGKDINKDEGGGADGSGGGGSDPAGVKLFKMMYPGMALSSPEGRKQYVALEQSLKSDPFLPMAVQMAMGDPRTIKMTPAQLQDRIRQYYEVVKSGIPDASGAGGAPAVVPPGGIPEGFTVPMKNKAGRLGYKNPKTGQIYVP